MAKKYQASCPPISSQYLHIELVSIVHFWVESKDIYFLLRDKMWENVFGISDLNGFFVSFTILKSERSGLITLQKNRAFDIYFFPM